MGRFVTHFNGDGYIIHLLNRGLFIVCILAAWLCLGESARADEGSKVIRVALMNNRPLSYQGDNGKAEGVYSEVIREIAKRENWTLDFILDSWRGSFGRLKNNQIDLMIAIVRSPEREKLFDFSREPVLTAWGQVYTKPGSKIDNILDLEGKKVAIMERGINGRNFMKLAKKFNVNCTFVSVPSFEDVCRAILAGEVDAGVMLNVSGGYLMRQFPVRPSPIVFNPGSGHFAAQKGKQTDVLNTLDRYLSKWKADKSSVYYQILNRNYGVGEKEVLPIGLILMIIGLGLAIALFFFLWATLLRSQVRSRTSELTAEKAFIETVIDSLGDTLFAFESETGQAIRWNQSFRSISGYTDEEIAALKVPDSYFDASDIEKARKSLEEVKEKGVSMVEMNLIAKDGRKVSTEYRMSRLPGDTTEPVKVIAVGRDITERKQAEDALRKSEEKYRNIFNNAQVAIFRTRMSDGKVLECNDRFARTYGYETPEECIADFVVSEHYIDPGVREKMVASLMEKGEVNDREACFSRKDGDDVWIRFSARAYPEEGYLEGIGYDITEEKKALEALRESEEKYRTLINNLPVAVYRNTPGPEGEFLMANPAFCRMFGFQNEEEVKKVPSASFYQNPKERQEYSDNLIRKEIILNDERTLLRRDGTPVHTSITSRVVYGKDGQVSCFDSIMLDITERKQAEEALLESEEKYRSMMEAMKDPVYICSPDFRVEYMNPAMIQRTGHDATGEDCFKTLHNLEEKCPWCMHDKAKQGEYIELEIVSPKDNRSYSISQSPVVDRGGLVSKLIIFRDITEMRETEAQLHRAQKMEAMGILAGGVAHDLNNILSGIVSYPELLLMDLPEDSRLRKPIKVIQESGMRAADVVEDLLTIARGIATGKETLNLNNIVTEYLESPEYQTLEKTHSFVNLKTELDLDLLNMSGSPTHIKKTLMNLVVNASEAIEGAGTVTISTMNRYLDEPLKGYEDVRTGEYAVLSVSDDGSGISSKDLERIFEPFYTKKVMGRSGTGLGLAVVWNTVQDHNGYIDVKSSKKGTVFELYFPVTRDEVTVEKKEVPLEDYLGHGEKILVVDDEERQREIASGMLAKLGYHIDAVSSGEEAIEFVKENPVDLIVLDMVMPKGINGRETYEEIIKIRPKQKAIIASGYAKTKEVDIAQRLGAGKYIKKPYILEKIGLAVKEELEK